MSEQFAVDSAFGDGAAVYCKILFALSCRVVVYEARDDFLAHAAFANDKHAKIGRRNLKSYVESMIEGLAIAHNVVSLFYSLKF